MLDRKTFWIFRVSENINLYDYFSEILWNNNEGIHSIH